MTRTPRSPADELETLAQHGQQLRLTRVGPLLSTHLEQAAQQELSDSAFLTTVLATEVAAKQEKHHTMQPSIDPKVIKELATMRFVDDLKRRKGADADQPHRIKYKPLVRK